MIAWTATGLLASTILAGCASAPVEHVPPQVIGVAVKDTPPADLLTCPVPAAPFPTDQEAVIPWAVRDRLKGLAISYRDLFDRQERLINWIAPGSCGKDKQ